jgi:hypothetical protein
MFARGVLFGSAFVGMAITALSSNAHSARCQHLRERRFFQARRRGVERRGSIRTAGLPPWSLRMHLQPFRKWGRLPEAGSPRLVHLSFQMIDLLAQPIVLSLEAIILALRLVALGAFRPFSQVFDLTSGPIVQGWVA